METLRTRASQRRLDWRLADKKVADYASRFCEPFWARLLEMTREAFGSQELHPEWRLLAGGDSNNRDGEAVDAITITTPPPGL